MNDLGEFHDRPIVATKATVAKVNERLSQTLTVAPKIFDVQERVFAIVHLVKAKDRFDYVRDDDEVIGAEQVQMFVAKSAVFFDERDKDQLLGTVLQKAVDMFIEAEAEKRGQLVIHMEGDHNEDPE